MSQLENLEERMMFPRTIAAPMRDGLAKPGTALLLYGPRQAGKTTLVR